MNKLVLTFSDEDEVLNIDKCLIFNNERDCFEYLQLKGLLNIKIEIDNQWFSFRTEAWSGNGRIFWAKQY